MNNVIEVTTLEELDKIIAGNDSVVVLWHAPSWCVPCRRFHPHFVKAAESFDAVFVEVDVDKAMEIATEYGVMSVPVVKHILRGEGRDIKSRTVLPLIEELSS